MYDHDQRTNCSLLLATCDSLYRTKVVESLLVERLLRKSRRVLDMWEGCERDWNQTLHEMAAYAMGAPRNSGAFVKLASKATFRMCVRERGREGGVEALLLGTSGLLNGDYMDDHIVRLQEEFGYLATKYDLKTMKAGEWDRNYSFPAGCPVVRIAQLAAIVAQPNFFFDDVVGCETFEDVARLLSAEVSPYWQKHYTIGGQPVGAPKRLGREKIVTMTINFVVPLQFAYAEVMQREDIKQRAMELLEQLPAEHNRIVSKWTGAGVPCTSAFDSQALIELQTYCDRGGCGACPLAKQIKRA